MKTGLTIVACAFLAAACASADPSAGTLPERQYATGSNIAKRDRVQSMTPEAFEQVRTQASGNTGRKPSP